MTGEQGNLTAKSRFGIENSRNWADLASRSRAVYNSARHFPSDGKADILNALFRQLFRRHMAELNNQLQSLRQADGDVARILDIYDEIARVYNSALEAMGVESSKANFVANSADVTISLQPSESVQSLTLLNG